MIWTRNLLIWSQTRYRCATESAWCKYRWNANHATYPRLFIKALVQFVDGTQDSQSGHMEGLSCVWSAVYKLCTATNVDIAFSSWQHNPKKTPCRSLQITNFKIRHSRRVFCDLEIGVRFPAGTDISLFCHNAQTCSLVPRSLLPDGFSP